MKRYTHNCNNIRAASKRDTNNIFLPYRTPILQGAISIINDFEKNKDDGVDYINLCDELNKYVNKQKECIDPNLKQKNMSLFNTEWKKTIKGIQMTFTKKNINRLCYWEGDKKKSDKEHVLNIYDEFRNFCIEKKPKETKSSLSFEECMDYLQWIKMKKDMILGMDPGYAYISDYSQFFDIRKKCNYPWLIDNKPDMICVMNTKTKPKEQDDLAKTSVDTSQSTPNVAQAIPAGDTKVNSASEKPSSQGDVNIDRPKPSNYNPKVPDKSVLTPDANVSSNVNKVAQFPDMNITGIDISKSGHDSNIKGKYINFSDLPAPFSGHKIPYTVRFPIHEKPSIFVDGYPVHVQRTQISRNPSNLYNIIRSSIPNQKQFQEPIVPFAKYSLILEHRDPPIYHFDDALPPFPIITSGNKKLDRVVLEPAIPDASYFRSPSMIYTLVFLAIFTIISTFYLFSK
ncbi:hypothetical protein POVCU1_055200, partial [Plasmodium ovale curtisi]